MKPREAAEATETSFVNQRDINISKAGLQPHLRFGNRKSFSRSHPYPSKYLHIWNNLYPPSSTDYGCLRSEMEKFSDILLGSSKDEIRLLRILPRYQQPSTKPGLFSSLGVMKDCLFSSLSARTFSCTLEETSLKDHPEYLALSYAQGEFYALRANIHRRHECPHHRESQNSSATSSA